MKKLIFALVFVGAIMVNLPLQTALAENRIIQLIAKDCIASLPKGEGRKQTISQFSSCFSRHLDEVRQLSGEVSICSKLPESERTKCYFAQLKSKSILTHGAQFPKYCCESHACPAIKDNWPSQYACAACQTYCLFHGGSSCKKLVDTDDCG